MNLWPTSVSACANAVRNAALVIFVLVLFTAAPAQQAASKPATRIWLAEPQLTTPTYVSGTQAAPSSSSKVPGRMSGSTRQIGPPVQILSLSGASARTLVSADFNGDGIADVAAGYAAPGGGGIVALYYGSLDALAPQSDGSFRAIGRGEFPAPFQQEARLFSVPVVPDFLAAGNFSGKGTTDLVVAASGSSLMYILPGDGKGNFGTPQAVNLSGAVTALSGGSFGRTSLSNTLIVGVSGANGPSLLVYRGAAKEPKLLASLPLGGPASSIAFGNMTGGSGADAVAVVNGDLFILSSSSMQLQKVAAPVSASAVALGSFVYDRAGRTQMAVLGTDGSMQIVVRSGIDSRPMTPAERKAVFLAAASGVPNPVVPAPDPNEGWKVLESFNLGGPGGTPVMLRTRISSNAADDVTVLNGSTGQMTVISHSNLAQDASTFERGLVTTRPYPGSPVAAVSMHVNIDGRPGIVALHKGDTAPSVMMPLPDPVFNVNTTNDVVVANACANNVANSCSLREAIIEANADNLNDTINVPAGTYTLTLTGTNKETAGATAAYGSLDIFHGVSINGAVDGGGNPITIVQAGTNNTNGIDKVFAVNPNADPGFDTHFSNLVIQFGKNPGSFSGGPATIIFPHGFGGGLFWEGSQTGNMSVVNCIIANNSTVDGDGGGIAADNAGGGTIGTGAGTFTLTHSTVQNNSAQESSTTNPGKGGGIWVTAGTPIVINGSQVLNNQAAQTVGGVGGQGGGIFLAGPSNNNTQSAIHGTSISGNTAAGHGGGISTGQGLLIDNSGAATSITNNTGDQGGGLWSNLTNDTTTVSKVTITGNTATGADAVTCVNSCGGGVFAASSGADTSHLTINFSRLAGNTAADGSNLANLGTVNSTDNANNDWWGTNTPASTIHDASGAVNTLSFIFLRHTPNPANIIINETSILTGDMSQDNFGFPFFLSGNEDVLNGVSITFNNAVLGTIVEAQPETLTASGQATATFQAGATAGAGSANVTVDQQTVTANISIAASAMPPTISKLFLPDTIAQTTQSFLSFTINNPNSDPNPAVTLTGISFTDNLPAGLQVASPNQATSDCGGTLTATPGSSVITLTGGSIDPAPPALRPVNGKAPRLMQAQRAQGACFISVAVVPTTTGTFNNTTGAISSNETGAAGTSNTATLTVTAAAPVQPPTAAKAFADASIPVNGTTTLTFTIGNPNTSTEIFNIELDDVLPSGLVVATPSAVGGSCLADGGTVIANSGSNSIIIVGLNLAGSSSCSYSVNVTGIASGLQNNVTSNITGSHDDGVGITGGSASASTVVLVPPSITKTFNPGLIAPTGVSVLSFTITNPTINPVALNGVSFTDTLPSGVLVASPNGATGTCNGGVLTATSGSNSVSLTGGTIPALSSCTVSANVTAAASGSYTNNVTVTSSNAGTGNTATATLAVAPPNLSITKSHDDLEFHRRGTGVYTITVSDSATAGPTLGTVTVTDALPDVNHTLIATAISGTGWTCDLPSLTCTRSDSLAPGASYPSIGITVSVPQNITANVVNTATVSGGEDPNSHTAQDPTHIWPPINMPDQKISDLSVAAGSAVSTTFPFQSSTGEGSVSFSCSGLPSGASCSFDPQSTDQLSATVGLTISTSVNTASAAPVGRHTTAPVFAMVLPLLVLAGAGIGGRKLKKLRIRLALLFGGALLSLALLSCGGNRSMYTTGASPSQMFPVTVSATSATTGHSATMTFNLTVTGANH